MALTDKETFYEILGLPQQGTAIVIDNLTNRTATIASSVEGKTYTHDFSNIITAVEARLTALSTAQETIVDVHVARWTELLTKPVQVAQGATGGSGTLADYPKEREEIRERIGNIVGVAIPHGGFMESARKTFGTSGQMQSLGDR